MLDHGATGPATIGLPSAADLADKAREALRASGDFVLSRYGVWLKRNWADATFNFCYHATYPPLLTDYLAAQTAAFSFVDVGANQGLYTLLATQNPACVSALAFEPVPKTFAFLEANVAANAHANKISLHCCAVTDGDGEATISLALGHSGAASLREQAKGLLRRRETIVTVGPDTLASLRPAHPAIIKVDVEGHERVVMQALADAGFLANARAVFYEVDTRWSDPAELEARLRQQGFNTFRQSGTGQHYDVLATRAPSA